LALGSLTTLAHAEDSASAPPVTAPPAAAPAKPVDPRANFVEKGRVGIIGALTEDNWKGGIVYEHEHFELQGFVHAQFGKGLRDTDVSFKAGGRAALGTLNYLAYGGDFRFFPGQKGSDTTSSAYDVGPYISLERYFAATPVMMCLWVNPVRFDHDVTPNADGTTSTVNIVQVIRTGGFGLTYLF
jgi:hypothetical protein